MRMKVNKNIRSIALPYFLDFLTMITVLLYGPTIIISNEKFTLFDHLRIRKRKNNLCTIEIQKYLIQFFFVYLQTSAFN